MATPTTHIKNAVLWWCVICSGVFGFCRAVRVGISIAQRRLWLRQQLELCEKKQIKRAANNNTCVLVWIRRSGTFRCHGHNFTLHSRPPNTHRAPPNNPKPEHTRTHPNRTPSITILEPLLFTGAASYLRNPYLNRPALLPLWTLRYWTLCQSRFWSESSRFECAAKWADLGSQQSPLSGSGHPGRSYKDGRLLPRRKERVTGFYSNGSV